ncbi:glycosyltransferase family 4 protein [Kaarinaea lacus]
MKVLELCLSYGVGGLELYAARITKQLADQGIDCVVVAKANTLFYDRVKEQNIKTYALTRWNRHWPIFSARALAKIIDDEAVDVLHMHWGKDLLLAVLAKRYAKRSVRLVYTRQMAMTRPKKDMYHRFLYKHVDLYLTITDELAQMAKQFLPMPSEHIKRLYYGVDSTPALNGEQRHSLRQQLGVKSDEQFAIGLVGRVEAAKGQHLLIEALHQLKQQGLSVHATIIGPAMTSNYLQQLQQRCGDLDLQQDVTFYGSHKNPIEIMAAFDAVVLATKKETFGLVLIEAMRNGVAVVGTNAGGVPEIIDNGETGLLFQPENAEDLAKQLRKLIDDPGYRQRLASSGKQKADSLFANEQHVQSLIEYFSQTIAAQ